MSVAEERRAARNFLAGYSLMSARELAGFLGIGESSASRLLETGRVPSINTGSGAQRQHLKVDPLDAAVYALAEREGLSIAEYWSQHGEATVDHARRFIERRRRFLG